MKKFLTVAIVALLAFDASAQVINPMGRPDRNGIIYSLNPVPPVISNNRISYSAGAPYVDAQGMTRACNVPLVVDHRFGKARAVCADKPAVAVSADNFSQLAPAAGGPSTRNDRNLPSDTNLGLRNDRNLQ